MNSPANTAPVISPRNGWQTLKGLALITPLLAVIWMAFISKLDHPTLSWRSPHFRAFWLWDAVGLFTVTWVIGLVARLLRREVPPRTEFQTKVWTGMIIAGVLVGVWVVRSYYWKADVSLQETHLLPHYFVPGVVTMALIGCILWILDFVVRLLRAKTSTDEIPHLTIVLCLFLAVGLVGYAGLFRISKEIVFSAIPLVVAVGFYVGSWPMSGQRKAAQQLTIMVSAFFAAAVWMGLRFEGQSEIGVVARTWLALGCAAGIWLALKAPEMERPTLHLGQDVIAGYLFAAGASLAPGVWGGEVRQLFAGDQTLFLAMVVGVNRWIRRFAALPEGPEQKLLSKLIPLTLCVALAMLYPLWHHLLPQSNLTDRRMCLVLGITLAGMLATCGFLKRLSPTQLDMTLSLWLASPLILLTWPNAWVQVAV